MMDADLLKLIADYALAAVFITLYVRSQAELAKAYREIAEQRREENREMRNILAELARANVARTELVERRGARVYETPDDWNERPPTDSRRPPNFPSDATPLPMTP